MCGLKPPPLTAVKAYKAVLGTAGAFPRDSFDLRIIEDVRNRTGRIPRQPGPLPAIAAGTPYPDADNDGMDDDWERRYGLDPAANDAWSDKNGDGWSNLDTFLDALHRRLVTDGQ